MAPRTKILKNCIISYTDDIPIAKREKIKGWVEHAGGSISKEVTDNVTHLLLTKKDWKIYPPKVKEARSRRTIYLVSFAWLEESLSVSPNKSKSKPLDECDGKYAYEPKHARKVAEKRREVAKAKMRTVRQKQEQEQPEEGDIDSVPADEMSIEYNSQQDDGAYEASKSGDESATKSTKVNLKIKDGLGKRKSQGGIQKKRIVDKKIADAKKLQEIFECGIKFDKSVLQTEREMANAGYRPYIDSSGFVHIIMLVRDDIKDLLHEQYTLKPPPSLAESHCDNKLPGEVAHTITAPVVVLRRHRGRARRNSFSTGEDTRLRYLEDPIPGRKSSARNRSNTSLDKLNDGQCTPLPIHDLRLKSHVTDRRWKDDPRWRRPSWTEDDQYSPHIPFSSLPVMSYTPASTSYPEIRVPLAQPFAYTLQLYESSREPEKYDTTPSPTATDCSFPTNSSCQSSNSSNVQNISLASSESLISFTQYLPQILSQDTPNLNAGPTHPSSPIGFLSTQPFEPTSRPPPKKTYMLLCQYTRKGKSRVSETQTLVPEGSTFELAMDMFRKIFRKKTGRNWDEVRSRRGDRSESISMQSDSNKDSGIELDGGSSHDMENDLQNGSSGQDSDGMKSSNGTVRLGFPEHKNTEPAVGTTETIQPITTDTVSPSPDDVKVKTSQPDNPAASIPTWTLASSKDVGRAGHRPFSYIHTDRKTFEEGNQKYKAQYGEDLFLFPERRDQGERVQKKESEKRERE